MTDPLLNIRKSDLESIRQHLIEIGALANFGPLLWDLLNMPQPSSEPKPDVWRISADGMYFYGTKEQCERERAEYESTFTAAELAEELEDGAVVPEPLFTRPAPAGVDHEREQFEKEFSESPLFLLEQDRKERKDSDFVYKNFVTDMAWVAWQARAKLNGAPK